MGLDMYLYQEIRCSPPGFAMEINGKSYPATIYIKLQVAYWRKANAIHGWIKDNCHAAEEDLRYELYQEDIIELRRLCIEILEKAIEEGYVKKSGLTYEVIKNLDFADDMLPVCQGPFFGSYEYDIDYVTDLVNTIDILEPLITNPAHTYYLYYASW